jgi:hypothetical protein
MHVPACDEMNYKSPWYQKGPIFWIVFFLCTLFNTASSAAPTIVSEDAEIESRTSVLPARRSNRPARSHPQSAIDLIHRKDHPYFLALPISV